MVRKRVKPKYISEKPLKLENPVPEHYYLFIEMDTRDCRGWISDRKNRCIILLPSCHLQLFWKAYTNYSQSWAVLVFLNVLKNI